MDSEHSLEVPAFTLGARVHRPTLGKALSRTLRAELRAALAKARVPTWVQERTETFVARLYPLVRVPGPSKWRPTKAAEKEAREERGEWVVSSGWLGDEAEKEEDRDPEDMARRFQEFYLSLDEEARRRPRSVARVSPVISRAPAPASVSDTSPSLSSTGGGSGDEADETIERHCGWFAGWWNFLAWVFAGGKFQFPQGQTAFEREGRIRARVRGKCQ